MLDPLYHAMQSFDPDALPYPVTALRVDNAREESSELPFHRHDKAQLVVSLQGGVMCQAEGGMWMVPPRCGVWIPGDMLHSNHITANGQVCLLFVDPTITGLPEHCCTLSLTPLVVELILHVAQIANPANLTLPHETQLITVLLEELRRMQVEQLHLPIPEHPVLQRIAHALIRHPDDRSTVAQWASKVAMSERTLARLVQRETRMSFGRWRQQLHILIALQRLAAGFSVQRVSDALGYESVSAFITMFRKALGKPPGRYIAEQ
ncbi:AraC family transcriptional regulator [Paenalcaligenes suwonensis]|uniref:AraC family transcriptional regulator n=1 Tax=Paenalcaligenes suwonensis TaxID=1202713 RepID=UPI001F60F89D|nr:helix-turn-helix transcriptional regulator [Paenalcaligenes suwonensis]